MKNITDSEMLIWMEIMMEFGKKWGGVEEEPIKCMYRGYLMLGIIYDEHKRCYNDCDI